MQTFAGMFHGSADNMPMGYSGDQGRDWIDIETGKVLWRAWTKGSQVMLKSWNSKKQNLEEFVIPGLILKRDEEEENIR